MRKTSNTNAACWIKRFLQEYLPDIRNMSRNTMCSYRDALCLLLEYMRTTGISVETMDVEQISRNVVLGFLDDLERSKGCSVATRNQRLAAIRSFADYVAKMSPEHLYWLSQLKSIPQKRSSCKKTNGVATPKIVYLEKDELKALLDAPDIRTELGRRDHALLTFMYNTGARASEVADLRIRDVQIDVHGSMSKVIIHGKGNKARACPLWKRTVNVLQPYMKRSNDEKLFLNRYGEPITRFGIYEMIERNVRIASHILPSIADKNVSPHTIRHTTASHLLEAGVDINTIRAWLGHVSVNTTNIYAEVNIRMKAEAIKTCEIETSVSANWKSDKSLLTFLKSL